VAGNDASAANSTTPARLQAAAGSTTPGELASAEEATTPSRLAPVTRPTTPSEGVTARPQATAVDRVLAAKGLGRLERAVLRALREIGKGAYIRDIAKRLGVDRRRVYHALRRLMKRGLVDKDNGDGKYYIALNGLENPARGRRSAGQKASRGPGAAAGRANQKY
jgi:Predicted transcriptional regulator